MNRYTFFGTFPFFKCPFNMALVQGKCKDILCLAFSVTGGGCTCVRKRGTQLMFLVVGLFVSHPIFYYLRPSFLFTLLLLIVVVTQIQGHTAGSSPSQLRLFVLCIFIAGILFSPFCPRRLASDCAYPR